MTKRQAFQVPGGRADYFDAELVATLRLATRDLQLPAQSFPTILKVPLKHTIYLQDSFLFLPSIQKIIMATLSKIAKAFPKAVSNEDLVRRVSERLMDFGYNRSNTLLASSLCCDEIARPLESNFASVYGQNFSMGGLAGMPFGGLTSFGAMAAHIPDGGSCLVIHGPHVGVDSQGNVGTVERRGKANGGACCGSAVAATGYALDVLSGKSKEAGFPTEVTDAQQAMVGYLLLPHAERLSKAEDTMVELPYALYDVQKGMIEKIIQQGAGNVKDGTIAVVGGLQINTPEEYSDYFLTLSFDLYNNSGEKVEDLLWD